MADDMSYEGLNFMYEIMKICITYVLKVYQKLINFSKILESLIKIDKLLTNTKLNQELCLIVLFI